MRVQYSPLHSVAVGRSGGPDLAPFQGQVLHMSHTHRYTYRVNYILQNHYASYYYTASCREEWEFPCKLLQTVFARSAAHPVPINYIHMLRRPLHLEMWKKYSSLSLKGFVWVKYRDVLAADPAHQFCQRAPRHQHTPGGGSRSSPVSAGQRT